MDEKRLIDVFVQLDLEPQNSPEFPQPTKKRNFPKWHHAKRMKRKSRKSQNLEQGEFSNIQEMLQLVNVQPPNPLMEPWLQINQKLDRALEQSEVFQPIINQINSGITINTHMPNFNPLEETLQNMIPNFYQQPQENQPPEEQLEGWTNEWHHPNPTYNVEIPFQGEMANDPTPDETTNLESYGRELVKMADRLKEIGQSLQKKYSDRESFIRNF